MIDQRNSPFGKRQPLRHCPNYMAALHIVMLEFASLDMKESTSIVCFFLKNIWICLSNLVSVVFEKDGSKLK